MVKHKKQNKIKELENRMDKIEDDIIDNHYLLIDHFWGLVFWTILVLFIILVAYTIYQAVSTPSAPEPYFKNANTFCEHYNMTCDVSIFTLSRCYIVINDSIIKYRNINYINDRYFFTDETK